MDGDTICVEFFFSETADFWNLLLLITLKVKGVELSRAFWQKALEEDGFLFSPQSNPDQREFHCHRDFQISAPVQRLLPEVLY